MICIEQNYLSVEVISILLKYTLSNYFHKKQFVRFFLMRAIIHWHLCQRNVDLYGINLSFQNQYQNAIAKIQDLNLNQLVIHCLLKYLFSIVRW